MRTVKLIFHIGRQKTATTYVQENLKYLKNVLLIGKSPSGRFYNNNIEYIHNEIFQPLIGDVKIRHLNPSAINFKTLDDYSEEIIKIILKNKEKEIFVISDENISNYLNYLGELNTFYTIIIGNLIEKKLKSKIKLNKQISLTIRNQNSILISLFSYNPAFKNSFKTYLNSLTKIPKKGFAGSLFYYEIYKMIESISDRSWRVNLIPYEILSQSKNPEKFLAYIINQKTIKLVDKEKLHEKINSTTNKSITNKIFYKKRSSSLYRLGKKLKFNRMEKTLINLYLNYVGIFLIFLHKVYIKFFRRKKFQVDNDNQLFVKSIYRESNKKLQRIIPEFDLKKFGYL